MTSRQPPRLALVFLSRLAGDREALVGDLLEDFQQGRSRTWFWRQVLSAVALELGRKKHPLRLGLYESCMGGPESATRRATSHPAVNLSGTGTRQIGGLGVLAIGVLSTIVVPQIWWLLLCVAAAGSALGAVLVLIRRRRLGRDSLSATRILSCLGFAAVVVTTGSAQESGRPAVPIDPIAGILNAFQSHQVVMLPGGFGAARRALLYSLLRDSRFQHTVNDIVVEFGSSRYQDAMDRFVRGDEVPYNELRRAWQDTTSPMGSDSPPVEEFYRTVREINASLPPERRMRVLLGEPPIDWDHVRTRQDHRKWVLVRDLSVADLIRREVIVRGRRALVLYGQLHYPRKEILANYDMSNWQAQTMVSWLEGTHGTKVFTIWADSAGVPKIQPEAASWPQMRLALIRGTVLGAADFTAFDPGTGQERYAIRGQEDFAPIPREQFRSVRMEDQMDAILYTGGGKPDPPIPLVSPRACADPGYVQMRLARIAIAGLPPAETAAIQKACGVERPLAGLWAADLSQSKLHANSPLREATLQFAVSDDAVTITDRARTASGEEIGTGTTTFRTDGEPHAHDALLPGLTLTATWRTHLLETVVRRKNGEVDRVTYEVSADGALLTTRTSGRLGEQVILFRRQ
jgi:hypothetical protein